MRPIPLEEFARRSGAQLKLSAGVEPSDPITGFATDSRDVKPGDLFLAIKGARVDGHDFVSDALARGAVAALVERPVDGPHLLVGNLVEALAAFGRSHREEFTGPVVGVTGSAGKTTTKEFIAAALSPLGEIIRTEGNRNTEYTSPLLWAEVTPETRAVVVEMAMRGFGQVAHLAGIARPTVGVVTNIGYSHMLQVGSREGIARAKGELLKALPRDGVAVLWGDDEFLGTLRGMTQARVTTFGASEGADCRVTGYQALDWDRSEVRGTLNGKEWVALVPAVGRHLAVNAAAAVLVASLLGVEPQDAADAIASAKLPAMRMEVRDLNGGKVLLDNYNAAPPSMIAAIETLAELPCEGRRLAVVGEMRELGDQTESAHRQIGEALANRGLAEVVLYGPPTEFVREAALGAGMPEASIRTASSLDEVRRFLEGVGPGDVVLVKGSRSLELEKALPEVAR